MMSKYNDEFVKLLVKEKEEMSLTQIAAKYKLTRSQAVYIIYKLGKPKESELMNLLYPKGSIYEDLRKASDELQEKNSLISRLIKLIKR